MVNISEPELRRRFIEGNSAVFPELVVTNREGVVLSHYDAELFGKSLADEENYREIFAGTESQIRLKITDDSAPGRILAVKRRPMGWVFLLQLDEKKLLESLYRFRNTLLVVLFLSLGISALAIFVISLVISRPVIRVFQHARKMVDQDKNFFLSGNSSLSEIAYLDKAPEELGRRLN